MFTIMTLSGYASIWLGYADIFIATFIMIYAYLFLRQTNEHKDRRPWDFLFIASFLYFIFQVFNVLFLSGVTMAFSNTVDLDLVRNIFAFLYSGSVLLAFVSQHDLILRSQLILISKKDQKPKDEKPNDEKKNDVEAVKSTGAPVIDDSTLAPSEGTISRVERKRKR